MTVIRVVMIVVGAGGRSSVVVGDGELDPDSFSSIPSNCGGQPLLFLFDFNHSGRFAGRAARKRKGEVIYLTSGRYPCHKTAVVLCDTPGKIARAPGCGRELHYAIYSTMFHRALFQLIVFTSNTPTLAKIPGLLNGQHPFTQGFKAELVNCSSSCEATRLQDFFGGPVDLNALIDILPVSPESRFIDDVDSFVAEERTNSLNVELNSFVQVEFNADGETELIDYDELSATDPVLTAVNCHMEFGPSPYEPLPLIFSSDLVMWTALRMVIKGASGRRSSEQPPESGGRSFEQPPESGETDESGAGSFGEDDEGRRLSPESRDLQEQSGKMSREIDRFMRRENGAQWTQLEWAAPYLHLRTLEGWGQALRAAQESLNKDEVRGDSS
jgi:hypothetical protein